MVDPITEFFESQADYDDHDSLSFFSGRFKKGKPHPDPDAKIGYCTSKKRAFVGYRATIIIGSENMPILDYHLTPANRHDSGVFELVNQGNLYEKSVNILHLV